PRRHAISDERRVLLKEGTNARDRGEALHAWIRAPAGDELEVESADLCVGDTVRIRRHPGDDRLRPPAKMARGDPHLGARIRSRSPWTPATSPASIALGFGRFSQK